MGKGEELCLAVQPSGGERGGGQGVGTWDESFINRNVNAVFFEA